ncbi:MAG: UvrD-helicase domain-containing protein [Inquilinus sp.]|uniref:UvrD-helicase domain-containing protein n=1 Tax=Inquilinus sp. TaxID=1932117 RepID=UPI003F3E675B
MFIWQPDDLNEEQAAAVEEPGSVFLTACPGSGKTRTLTYRVARELSRLTSPKQRVLAITFTHRAADEIHERIDRLGVDTEKLWIGTIHAFCLEWILKPYGLYHPRLQHGFHIVDEFESEKLLMRLCREANSGITHFDCGHFVTSTGFKLTSSKTGKYPAIKAVLKNYFSLLRSEKRIDFELILYYAYELIRDQPSISKLLGSIFSCVLVDEYQDTKEIQYEILASILKASDGRMRAFVVGDPNQAIYGSLGGHAIDSGIFAEQANIIFRLMELSNNYRSSQRIVGYFGNYNRLTSAIKAVGEHEAHPSLISFDRVTSRDELHNEIVRLIRYNIEEAGIPAQEVCVVAPWWVHLAATTRRLATALPQYTFDGPGMIPFARDKENFWYLLSRLILTEPSPHLFVRRMRWAGEVLDGLAAAGVSISLSRRALLRHCNEISISETNGLAYLDQAFMQLSTVIGVDPDDFPVLREHRTAFFEASADRVQKLVKEGAEAIEDVTHFRQMFAERKGITVSTIHGVKGAEYDAVIAYGLLEGMVPHFNDPDPEASAEKLLYVTCSRARKNLHLISESGRPRGRDTYQPTSRLLRCVFAYDPPPRPSA